jgi:light-regulated signal transduction histidine kinase (bacteriophytochrome)
MLWRGHSVLYNVAPMSELTASSLDLTNCDREPIHIPGSIQPHGMLLTLDPAGLKVLQAAGDTGGALGRSIEECLDCDIRDVLGADALPMVRSFNTDGSPEPLYLGSVPTPGDPSRYLDLTAHTRDGVLVLEVEPSPPRPNTAAQMLAKVRRVSAELEAAPDLERLLQVASQEARRLTGFDRVMIYRFLDDGSGSVAAEDKIDDLDSLLHHHYPASDIPKQARALYLQNLIRVIVDASYTPAPLVPSLNPMTGKPLDMSDCALRSVSPIHLQYLKNMGVAASMSVSIVVDGALWGLISCHHTAPKLVPYELREACKHLGQILSQQVKAREEASYHRQVQRLAATREEVLGILARTKALEQGLVENVGDLRRVLPADGAAIVFRDQISRTGYAPTEVQIRDLTEWLWGSTSSEIYATNSLAQHYSPAEAYAAKASGLIATVVSGEEPIVLLWFRAEHVETINWAGNPHKPVEPGGDLGMLSPRKSFETWKETVRHRAQPWSAPEVDAARRFGRAVLDLRQQNTLRELNVQLRRTLADKEILLAQKDLLMQEVNHRVQNSLQLVNSMLSLQARQVTDPDVRAHFDEASRRIMAVSMVHRRLWRADHIESVDFGSYLEELRDGLLEAWGSAWAGRIKVHARHVMIPTNQAVVLALVVTELLTNAVKYAYQGKPGPIDVTVREEGRKSLCVAVRDQGVGVQANAPKSGLGSRLVRSLVGQLGGELEVKACSPGTSFNLTVPFTPNGTTS